MGNGTSTTSSSSKSKVHHHGHHVHYYANNKTRSRREQQHGFDGGAEAEFLENDEAFSEYIRRAKQNIRTVSYVGNSISNNYPATVDNNGGSSNNSNNNVENEMNNFRSLFGLLRRS
ncbi:hypothetical protein PIB30_030401 [Stylosanthes scabra]|uniref:Uncharacterized protein n=1 Tax=Stylosanthes scabra TaxID=79078 RepID=A0ABU6YAD1_9FABA|nr:hypothetical protein [Stylosanthes scabra]